MRFSKDKPKDDNFIDVDILPNKFRCNNSYDHEFVMKVINSDKFSLIITHYACLYESIPADVKDSCIIVIKEWRDNILHRLVLYMELTIYHNNTIINMRTNDDFYYRIVFRQLTEELAIQEQIFASEIVKCKNKSW
jgi:hypothetical protein